MLAAQVFAGGRDGRQDHNAPSIALTLAAGLADLRAFHNDPVTCARWHGNAPISLASR
jgi:hypothetical protein